MCYTCGQTLHDNKLEELKATKQKELEDSISYQAEMISFFLDLFKTS